MLLKSCKKVRSNTIQMKQFKKNTLFDIKINKLSILKSSLKILKVPSISTFSINSKDKSKRRNFPTSFMIIKFLNSDLKNLENLKTHINCTRFLNNL